MDALLTVGLFSGRPPAVVDLAMEVRRRASGYYMLVDDNPYIPDTDEAVLHGGPSPALDLAAMAQGLERAGAQILALADDTAHAFLFEIERRVGVPLVSMVEETGAAVAALAEAPEAKVGLLANEACLASGLYQTELARRGLTCLPREAPSQTGLAACVAELEAAGAEILILTGAAPTNPLTTDLPLVRSTEALAAALAEYIAGTRPLPPPFAWTEVGEA